MCDHSGKLMAFLDRELDAPEMTIIERHLQECAECRTRVSEYEQVSKAFDEFCSARVANAASQRRQWVPAVSLAAAATAVAAALMLFSFRSHNQHPAHDVAPVAYANESTAAAPEVIPDPLPRKPEHSRHAASHRRTPPQQAWLPTEPAIEVAIPAESVLPPGAVPEGVNFIANVSFAADGSAQQIQLRPQMIRFERRPIQP